MREQLNAKTQEVEKVLKVKIVNQFSSNIITIIASNFVPEELSVFTKFKKFAQSTTCRTHHYRHLPQFFCTPGTRPDSPAHVCQS